MLVLLSIFFFQAEDGIRDYDVTGVQTCALPISTSPNPTPGQVRGPLHCLDGLGGWCRRLFVGDLADRPLDHWLGFLRAIVDLGDTVGWMCLAFFQGRIALDNASYQPALCGAIDRTRYAVAKEQSDQLSHVSSGSVISASSCSPGDGAERRPGLGQCSG